MNLSATIAALLSLAALAGCGQPDGVGSDGTGSPTIPFVDATARSGLSFVHNAGLDSSYYMPESIGSGGAFIDYDDDGDLDIYLVNGAWRGVDAADKPQLVNRLFRQQADGTFEDVTESSGLGDTGYGMGVAAGDIDNDGDVDVYITNVGSDALYRNNGDGTFAEISQVAGIGDDRWGASAVFFDFDLDGDLDIYVTNYVVFDTMEVCTDRGGRPDYCGPSGFPGVPDILYRNQGDGTFVDVSAPSGIAKGASKGLGVVAADFNGDIYPDLYVSNDGEPNHLWINQGDGTFVDRALIMGAAVNALGQAEAGMGIAIGDVDNDADLDLFVTHLRGESNTLYRNEGESGFRDDTGPALLGGPSLPFTGFGTGFIDYDHDGDLDLAVVNGRVTRGPLMTGTEPPGYWDPYAEPDLLFANDGQGRFRPLAETATSLSGSVENSRGLLFGDVDDDGDIDLLVTNEGGPARLLLNSVEKEGHWLMIRALDPGLQRDAIGARITVVAGSERFHRLVTPGYSFLSSNDMRAHFGLGPTESVDEIAVQWPDGVTETFSGVRADQMITLSKGSSGQ